MSEMEIRAKALDIAAALPGTTSADALIKAADAVYEWLRGNRGTLPPQRFPTLQDIGRQSALSQG